MLGVLGSTGLITIADGTILYPALPAILRDLSLDVHETAWVTISFLLSFTGLLVSAHRIADRFGRRRMFVIGMAVLTAGSVLGGVSWDLGSVVAARGLQGIGTALVVSTTLPLLVGEFIGNRGHQTALGVWTAIGALGGTAGLLAGGIITDTAGWRAIFFGSAAVALCGCVLGRVLLRGGRDPRAAGSLGLGSAALTAAAMAAFSYALSQVPGHGWFGPRTRWPLTIAAVLVLIAAVRRIRDSRPLFGRTLSGARNVLGGIAISFSVGIATDGALFLYTNQMQMTLGFNPMTFALALIALTLSAVVSSFIAQIVIRERGLRSVAVVAAALVVAGLGLSPLLLAGDRFITELVSIMVLGAGLGGAFVAGQVAIVSEVADPATPAAGLADAAFGAGGAAGLAILSVTIATGESGYFTPGQARIDLTGATRAAFVVAACLATVGLIGALLLRRRSAVQAFGGPTGSS